MIGYGAEDAHFVCELTYNYGVGSYKLGNDFQGLIIHSNHALKNAKDAKALAPDNYPFHLVGEDVESGADPVQGVIVGVKSKEESLKFWRDLLGMNVRPVPLWALTSPLVDQTGGEGRRRVCHTSLRRQQVFAASGTGGRGGQARNGLWKSGLLRSGHRLTLHRGCRQGGWKGKGVDAACQAGHAGQGHGGGRHFGRSGKKRR